MKEPNELREEALKQVAGGFAGSAPAAGAFEAPIVLDTEAKVRSFTDAAKQCSFEISVRDRSVSVDGKDFERVLALDRSGFVTVFARCSTTDPFFTVACRYMDF